MQSAELNSDNRALVFAAAAAAADDDGDDGDGDGVAIVSTQQSKHVPHLFGSPFFILCRADYMTQ